MPLTRPGLGLLSLRHNIEIQRPAYVGRADAVAIATSSGLYLHRLRTPGAGDGGAATRAVPALVGRREHVPALVQRTGDGEGQPCLPRPAAPPPAPPRGRPPRPPGGPPARSEVRSADGAPGALSPLSWPFHQYS